MSSPDLFVARRSLGPPIPRGSWASCNVPSCQIRGDNSRPIQSVHHCRAVINMIFVAYKPPPFTVVDLLIKLSVMALLAGYIARFSMFRRLLLIEQRGPREKIQFAAFLGLPFMVGVLVRLLASYPTTDLS